MTTLTLGAHPMKRGELHHHPASVKMMSQYRYRRQQEGYEYRPGGMHIRAPGETNRRRIAGLAAISAVQIRRREPLCHAASEVLVRSGFTREHGNHLPQRSPNLYKRVRLQIAHGSNHTTLSLSRHA